MAISDDWNFDYPNKVLSHIDGVLSYDSGTSGQAAVGDYIIGDSSGAVGKVLAVTGNAASGTYTLTNVVGLFEDNESISLLSYVGFDAVTAGNGGFKVGDTLVDQSTGSIDVKALEYNADGNGGGVVWGTNFTSFTDDQQIDISGGQTDVADVDTAAGNQDNDTIIDTAQAAGTLAVPGTANTNDSVIIHYDSGSVPIPEQAIVEDATTGAKALVEQVYGVTATGSLRLVDYDSTGGVFTDNNNLRVDQVIAYTNQVAGKVFSVGDVVEGGTSGAKGRVLYDSGSYLILADESGTWTNTEDLNVSGVKIAEASGTNTTQNVAVIDIPFGIRTEQRPTAVGGGVGQGGIYDSADSLNIVRKFNSLYTLTQDTFDELLQLDDDEALDAAVKGGAYSLVYGWFIPDLSLRFVRQGGLTDSSGANVWANPQTVGTQNKITATAFDYTSSQPYRQPQLYIEQDQRELDAWWLEGQIDVLVKTRSRTDPRYIAPATPGLGQLIPGGDPAVDGAYTVFNREYHVSTYDATQSPAAASGVNTIALGTGDDTTNNDNGTHTLDYTGGSGVALEVGEEFTAGSGNSLKVGIVVSDDGGTGATGTLEYVLKSGTNFVNTDSCTASISGKTFTAGTPTTVVAGYGANIAFPVVDIAATPSGGTGITGTFYPGEDVTQAVTGATGRVVYANTTTDVLYLEVTSGTFSGDNDITGDESTASWDAGTGATYPTTSTFSADLNDGSGAESYTGTMSGDLTGASPQTVKNIYQYSKYLNRHEEESYTVNGPGTADTGTLGKFFRKLDDAYAETKPGSPITTYTGSLVGAQGWFLDSNYIDSNDIRSFSVINNSGVKRNPPNLQSLTITGVAAGWRVSAYRSTGVGNTEILRAEFTVGAVGTHNQAGDSTILLAANTRSVSPLPADVPDTGVLRILDPNDSGNYLRFPYSSVNRTTNVFTLASGTIGDVTNATDLTNGDNAHVVFVEQIAAGTSVTNTIQYIGDIPLVYKGRLKGYKPFRSTTTFGSSGAQPGVVQTPDTIVDLP
jgi:hypothetical protein